MNKRIGLVLASIHEGASIRLWRSVLSSVDLLSDSVVVFPGGRLNYKEQDEYLRNNIYSLETKENFDGIINWSSSLTGELTAEEVCSIIRSTEVPVISIGLPVEGSPSVTFDAYEGMYNEVEHFITKHKLRRIAFLRGPNSHASAESRYCAYEDCLKKYNIPINNDLISSPHHWAQGREALREIINERGLVPGIDFDALICASDLMLSGALRYLEEINVEVPGTLKVAGFNDSDNNKIMKVAPTTVRMPVVGMSHVAVEILNQIFNDPATMVEDVILPAELVIRHSCGCDHSFGATEPAGKELENKENFISWIRSLTQDQISYSEVKAFIDYAFEASKLNRESDFVKFRDRFLFFVRRFLESGGELYDLLDVYKCFFDTFNFPKDFSLFFSSELMPSMIETYSRYQAEVSYKQSVMSNKVNALKNKLLSIRSNVDLGNTLRSDLPKLGIKQCYLVFANYGEGISHLETGFDRQLNPISPQNFPAHLLLPEVLSANISKGAYVLLPLTYDKEYLGYLLVDVTEQRDEQFLEDLRATISSTLKGISLLEAANRAKDVAEKAERASSDFFDSISDGLKEPLQQMKQILSTSDIQNKKDLLNHLLKAEHLLDLCYTEKGQIELKKKLISPTPFFKDIALKLGINALIPDSLPAIYADPEKVTQVSEILYQLASEDNDVIDIEVSIKPSGLSVLLSSDSWNPMQEKDDAALSLAEKIVVLHSGTFHFKEHGIAICYPWPSLSSEITQNIGIGYTLYIKKNESSTIPNVVRTLPQVLYVTENDLADEFEIPDNVTRIAWDYGDKRERDSVVLNLLKNHQRSKSMPFLCFNVESSSLDLWSTLKAGTHDSIEGVILVLGTPIDGLSKLKAFGSFLLVKSEEELLNYTKTPAMIILNSSSYDIVLQIRKEKRLSKVPVLMVKDHFNENEIEKIAQLPNLIISNSSLCDSDEFISRLIGIFGGNGILPPLTGALVKKAIGYINKKATCQISRWQLAEYVNISEDYLTRIFKKDMGLSPWDYLNRYRVQLATEMLTQTGSTINEVASATGFQDQAYFCRVFKKIKGVSPGQVRNRN